MEENKRIALIGIIVEEAENSRTVDAINEILHEYGNFIVGRMGVPYRERGINIISIIVDADNNVISSLAGKLGKIENVSVKSMVSRK